MIYLLIICMLCFIIPVITGDWFTYMQLTDLQILILSYIGFKYMPWGNIKPKACALIVHLCSLWFFLFGCIDNVLVLIGKQHYYMFYPLLATSFILFCVVIAKNIVRKVRTHSDKLDNDHLYYVFVFPDDFRTLLWSLFNLPYGGCALYAKGRIYGYRHSKFQRLGEAKFSYYKKHGIFINTGKLINDNLSRQLRSLLGREWSIIKNNCFNTIFTTFGTIRV